MVDPQIAQFIALVAPNRVLTDGVMEFPHQFREGVTTIIRIECDVFDAPKTIYLTHSIREDDKALEMPVNTYKLAHGRQFWASFIRTLFLMGVISEQLDVEASFAIASTIEGHEKYTIPASGNDNAVIAPVRPERLSIDSIAPVRVPKKVVSTLFNPKDEDGDLFGDD